MGSGPGTYTPWSITWAQYMCMASTCQYSGESYGWDYGSLTIVMDTSSCGQPLIRTDLIGIGL